MVLLFNLDLRYYFLPSSDVFAFLLYSFILDDFEHKLLIFDYVFNVF